MAFFKKRYLLNHFSIGIILLFGMKTHGQLSAGGTPYSFTHSVKPEIDTVYMPEVDNAELARQDDEIRKNGQPRPFKFGTAIKADINFMDSSRKEKLLNGDNLYRLCIVSKGAYSINLIYNDFFLAEGCKLYLYSEHSENSKYFRKNSKADSSNLLSDKIKQIVLGAFTDRNTLRF